MRKCTKTLSETETLEIYQNKLPWLHLLDQDVDFTGHTNAYCFISFNIQITHSIYSSYNRHHYTRSWSQYIHLTTGIITRGAGVRNPTSTWSVTIVIVRSKPDG